VPAATLTLYDLLPDILGRLEEDLPVGYNSPSAPPNPAGAPDGPVFWHLKGEIYVQLVDAMFEANLLTGFVQVQDIPVTLAAGQTYFALQNNLIIGIPDPAIAVLRMKAPYQIRKTSQAALDAMFPKWQQVDATDQIRAWFPLGMSYFGIYPQVAHQQTVIMDFIICPVNQPRPYDGTQTVPLPQQFYDLLTMYAAAMLRSKEGGAEAEEADTVFAAYTSRMKELSLFQNRIDSVDYTAAQGAALLANPRKTI
jgi:hypothetical protein